MQQPPHRYIVLDAPPGIRRARQWRGHARALVSAQIAPNAITWTSIDSPSFDWAEDPTDPSEGARVAVRLTTETLALFERVACHQAPERFALLYEAVWRLAQGERHLFDLRHDRLVRTLCTMDAAVRRELHKTKAFVRFEPRPSADGSTHYVAWFEPEHDGLELVLPFFRSRFPNMRWSILTPRGCARWDGKSIHLTSGLPKPAACDDPLAAAWPTYYASIFNPARLKVRAMVREMPKRYWANLPEAKLIPHLTAGASPRTARMLATPARVSLPGARRGDIGKEDDARERPSLETCLRCPHAEFATQAVPGSGARDARIMLVGEQPGDEEDLAGEAFIGPAGKALDRVLSAAGLGRDRLYLTNAVKHFQWTLRGKRRIHKTPGQREILACRDHLLDELATIDPRVIVALGATAASALTANTGLVLDRHEPVALGAGRWLMMTFHPAYLLRAGSPDARAAFASMVATFERAKALVLDEPYVPPA